MSNFRPIILSGGSGTRMWPISRRNIPKQFNDLWSPTLFEKSIARLIGLGEPITVCHEDQVNLCVSGLQKFNLGRSNIIAEPVAKNTGPAIALAIHSLGLAGYSGVVGVFPSDQLIKDEPAFQKKVELAIEQAEKGGIVTLGISPTFPSTGFGYIELDNENNAVSKVKSFREKPDLDTAKQFLESGLFAWNAGMFIAHIDTLRDAFLELMPEMWKQIQEIESDLNNVGDVYNSLKPESFDYGVMEKHGVIYCVPSDIGWSDVGSWDEVVKQGGLESKIYEIEASGNTYLGRDKSAAFIGVENLVAVDSSNALLIFDKGSSQSVKKVYEAISKDSEESLLSYQNIDFRPWGSFEVLRDEDHFKSKLIRVNPGHQISYQSHAKRAEHWIIVKGNPEVVLDDEVKSLTQGESIYIPQGAKHRIRNTTGEVVEFVEVQVGTYFGEDDIVRYEDDYARS